MGLGKPEGSEDATDAPPSAESQPRLVAVPIPIHTELVTVRAGVHGGNGEYEVSIVFRHPIHASGVEGRVPLADEKEGDSGIGIPEPTTFRLPIIDYPHELTINLVPNAAGRLGKATSRLTAESPGKAASLVQNHLGVLLSRLCFEIDAPAAVAQVDTREVATGILTQFVILRGQTRGFRTFPEIKVTGAFLRAAFSLYREGLNSTNPYYSLLCFYRVASGCNQYYGRVNALRRARGLDPRAEQCTFEDIDGVAIDFPDWIGRSCGYVTDELTRKYRVPVAHGLGVDDVLLAADQVDQESAFWKVVPAARQVARKLLSRAKSARDALEDAPIAELGD